MVAVTLIAAGIGAVAGAAGLVTATVAGSAALGGALIYGGLSTASYLVNRALAPKFDPINVNELNAQEPLARETTVAATTPARWILGRARSGGFLTWYYEEGDDAVHLVYTLSEGPCEGLRGVYIKWRQRKH